MQRALQSSAGLQLDLPLDLQLEATLFQMALFNLSDSVSLSRLDDGDGAIDQARAHRARAVGSN